ncbi:MAG TPA: IS21-like element helper ATPase IstB [Candidatus Acidoferrales bacterium]|nr:IS21-like element helper ATPase IstB [Candidatus Acidoferrales bacterium]
MNAEMVRTQLKALKMTAAANELDEILSRHRSAASLGWMSELLDRELDARKERAIERRIESAEFPEIKTLEGFDWEFNRKIERAKIEELGRLEFVKQRRIALLLGQAGTGKTHVALALGLKAAKEGMRVYCASVKRLAEEIRAARTKGTLDAWFRRVLGAHLWIVDDWGVISMAREIAEEVFDLLDRRKLSSAMILTSNRDINEWGEVFPDPVLANAAIDRMFEAAEIVVFQGKSYRLKDRIELPSLRPEDVTPKRREPAARKGAVQ